jgi:hypothetical protein
MEKEIYINKGNYREHLNLDVVAFSYAHGGAMGVGVCGMWKKHQTDGKV